jgi:diguanylate cyclase (GGDEF)-like protein
LIKKILCFALNAFLLIFLTSNIASARAQNNFDRTSSTYKDISADIESVNLGLNIPHLRDANGNLTIEDILNQDETSWSKRNEEIPNLGVDPANFWFKHTLRFTNAESKDYLLEIGYPALDYIDVYFIQNNRVHYSYNAGDHLPFSSRPIDHRNFLFPLPKFNANQNVDIVIRVQTAGAVQLPLVLWQQTAFWEQDQSQLMLQTLFVAILLTIALYNLMLFASMRDRAYLLYVCYICCLAFTQLSLRGLNYQLFVQDSPYANERILLVSIGLAIFFAGLFAHKFMSLADTGPKLGKVVLLIAYLGLAQAVSGLFVPYALSITAGIALTPICCAILLLAGMVQWLHGNKVARFFTLAWAFYLIGQFSIALSKLGLLPRTPLLEYGPELGASVGVILLSFALADRMNEEKRMRYAAQNEALLHEQSARKAQEHSLQIQHQANEELESRVDARTQELQSTLEQLSVANEKLHGLSTVDGLTQLRNRRAFDERLDNEWRRSAREKSELSLIMLDADHFKNINDTYGHQAGDECLKILSRILSDSVRRPSDCVARYGGEEFAIILPHTKSQGAGVIAERIRSRVEAESITFEGQAISLTVSIGLGSMLPTKEDDPNTLLEHADKALYRAKSEGRNRIVWAEV